MTSSPAQVSPRPFAARLDELAAQVSAHRHGRVPAELRRCHIVAVATGLFAERGFHDASMDELAGRAGVSKPVIYGLVGDKERLFRTCVEAVASELAGKVGAAMRAERDPEACLRAGARAFFTFVAAAGSAWDRLQVNEGVSVSGELMAARERHAGAVAEVLADLVAGPGRAPVGREQIEALAYAVNGACEALVLWWRRHPERSVDELVEVATRLLVPSVLGVVARPAGRVAGEAEPNEGGAP